MTAVLLALGIYGTMQLDVKFQYIEFLPSDSGLYQWFSWNSAYFPGKGDRGKVYLADIELSDQLGQLDELTNQFKSHPEIIPELDSWYPAFKDYLNTNFLAGDAQIPSGPNYNMTSPFFQEKLTQFLVSPNGAKFMNQFQFDGPFVCGEPAPEVKLSTFEFYHPHYTGGASEYVPAMNWVKDTIKGAGFDGGISFAMSQSYSRWEIDEVISRELYRNLLLSIVCVTFTTLLLLADLRSCLLVILNVVITLVMIIVHNSRIERLQVIKRKYLFSF